MLSYTCAEVQRRSFVLLPLILVDDNICQQCCCCSVNSVELNENWTNDVTIPRNSVLLERFGKHTLSLHFKPEEVKNLKGLVIGLQNIGNTCYMNAVL